MKELLTQDKVLLPEKDLWAFEALKELLMREKGLDLEAYKERCVLRRIFLRSRSRGFPSLGDYFRELTHNPQEVEALFHYLTIHVTQFFRNPPAFRFIRNRILPHLTRLRGSETSLRIWCVGCASGEEPYSLAILIRDLTREGGDPIPFHIYATDVDAPSLEKARRGIYPHEALRNLTEAETAENFDPPEEGHYRIKDELRRSVTFRFANILTDRPSKPQHLILCRNLLIYFSRPEQERIISRLAEALLAGGYLMLGKAETLVGRNRNHFQTISPTERIYQKRELPLEGKELPPAAN